MSAWFKKEYTICTGGAESQATIDNLCQKYNTNIVLFHEHFLRNEKYVIEVWCNYQVPCDVLTVFNLSMNEYTDSIEIIDVDTKEIAV